MLLYNHIPHILLDRGDDYRLFSDKILIFISPTLILIITIANDMKYYNFFIVKVNWFSYEWRLCSSNYG